MRLGDLRVLTEDECALIHTAAFHLTAYDMDYTPEDLTDLIRSLRRLAGPVAPKGDDDQTG